MSPKNDIMISGLPFEFEAILLQKTLLLSGPLMSGGFSGACIFRVDSATN